MAQIFTMEIDASDLQDKITRLQANMTEAQFERAMYGIFQRTGRHVAQILRKDLPQKYEVKPGDISASVKSPQLSMGFGGVGCSIPIRAVRGKIGSQYRASGGAHGWNSVKRKYKVKGIIPAKYRVPGAAIFWGSSAGSIHHVAYLWKPVKAGHPEGDWYIIEARGVSYGVVSGKLLSRKPDYWGLMDKYFDYSDEAMIETPVETVIVSPTLAGFFAGAGFASCATGAGLVSAALALYATAASRAS